MHTTSLFAVTCGLIAAVSWGTADFFSAKAARKIGALNAVFYVCAVAALLYALVYVVWMRSYTHWVTSGMAYAIVAGFCYTLAMASFFKALKIGPVNIVSPLGSLYPLITTVLLVLVFGGSISAVQGAGIGLVILGAMVAAGLFSKVGSTVRVGLGPLLGLLAALSWGVGWTCMTRAVDSIGWQFAALIQAVVCVVGFIPLLAAAKRSRPVFAAAKISLRNPYIIGVGLLQIVGFLAVSIGLSKSGGSAAVAVAVSASYPILTVFLALTRLGEKAKLLPLSGALVGVLGVVVLSLG